MSGPRKRKRSRPESDLAPAWQAELRRGLRRLVAGDFEGAYRHFERAQRLAPDQPDTCVALGRELFRRGDPARAEPLLRQAWDTDPTLTSAAVALARLLVGSGRVTAAHALLDDAETRHADEPALRVVRAEAFLAEARLEEARSSLATVSSLVGAGSATAGAAATVAARLHNADGLALATAGRHEEALFAFKRAADLDPDWAAPLCNLGSAFQALGRLARARSTWERALVIDASNLAALLNLAALAEREGSLTAAEDLLREAVEHAPNDLAPLCALARLLARGGRYLEAAEAAGRARSIDATGAEALLAGGPG